MPQELHTGTTCAGCKQVKKPRDEHGHGGVTYDFGVVTDPGGSFLSAKSRKVDPLQEKKRQGTVGK